MKHIKLFECFFEPIEEITEDDISLTIDSDNTKEEVNKSTELINNIEIPVTERFGNVKTNIKKFNQL